MAPVLSATLLVLAAVSAIAVAYACVVMTRVRRSLRAAPPLPRWSGAPEPPGGWPVVCVVVPAHNEQGVIGRLVRSLREQEYPALRVVLALDRCTDGTRREAEQAAAGDDRFEIVEVDECPPDWAGKTHAAWRGVRGSTFSTGADALLFTDADAWFAPTAVLAAVAAATERGLGLLSLLNTLDAHSLWELALQPTAAMELLRQNPLDRVNSPDAPRSFANGQFLLFTREAYERLGGHESVRDALLEDIALARLAKKRGVRFNVLPSGGLVRVRMYESARAFVHGWKRIYLEACRRYPWRLRGFAARLLLAGAALPLLCVASIALGAFALPSALGSLALGAGVLGLLAWALATGVVWRLQEAPAWSVALAPVGAAATAWIMLSAASDLTHRRALRWGGREYRLAPESPPPPPARMRP